MNHNLFVKFEYNFLLKILLVFLCIFIAQIYGCSQNIENTGYEINDKISDLTDEKIIEVLNNVQVPNEPKFLGTVRTPNFSEIRIEQTNQNEVYSSDVETYIEKLRDKNVEYYYDYKRFVDYGDMVNIDFVGSVDDIIYPELCTNPENGGVTLVIGSNSFINGFEEQLIAKRNRRTYSVTINLPEDYPNQTLANKTAVFKVTINRIFNAKTPDTNEEFYSKFSPSKSTYSVIFRQEINDMLVSKRDFEINMEYEIKIKEQLMSNSIFIPTTEAIAWQFANVVSDDINKANIYKISLSELIKNAGYTIPQYYRAAVLKAINNLKPIMLNKKLKEIYNNIKITNEDREKWFINFKSFAKLHEAATFEQLYELYGMRLIDNEIYDYYIYKELQKEVNIYEPAIETLPDEEESELEIDYESDTEESVIESQIENGDSVQNESIIVDAN